MIIVSTILIILAIYLFAGLVFAIPFIAKGVTKIDEGTHGASWGFRIIIMPGTIVFWPFLLNKWLKTSKAKDE
jgi:hypothetical protein